MSNEQEIAAIAKTLARAGLLSEHYNKSVATVLVEAGYCKDGTSFERYLLDKLLKSGCDCCSICAHTPPNELCESENVEDCYCGIREFYERFMEEK